MGLFLFWIVDMAITVFWILDILNMPFMIKFDTTYPLNTGFWFLFFLFYSSITVKTKSN